jgi:hypothetical protein
MTTYAAHPTTPRLLSITLFSATYCTDFPKYYSVPRCYTEVPADYSTEAAKYFLPQSTQPQLRRPSITLSRLATQKLLFRATLNRNTTLMLQSTTPRQPPSTTPKKPPITQLRTLPSLLHRGI